MIKDSIELQPDNPGYPIFKKIVLMILSFVTGLILILNIDKILFFYLPKMKDKKYCHPSQIAVSE